MADVANPPAPDGKVARRIGLALVGLLLAGCCFWSGLGAWFFAPLTPLWANHVDEVRGKIGLVVPAQSGATTGHLSPDGRQMILGWTREEQQEWVVLDLTTNVSRPFARQTSALCWLSTSSL